MIHDLRALELSQAALMSQVRYCEAQHLDIPESLRVQLEKTIRAIRAASERERVRR